MTFEAELESLRPRLRQHCRTLAQSREDVEDLEQQTFLRAWQARGSYGHDRPMINWLIRIAGRLNLDRKRGLMRRPPTVSYEDADLELIDVIADDEPGIDALLAFRSEREERIHAVEAATPPLDHVFIREVLSGKSNAEIARSMGATPLAVRHRAHRLHKRLASLAARD